MGNDVGKSSTRVKGGQGLWAQLVLAPSLLMGASSYVFGGGQEEEPIDPDEATARETSERTETERERDRRFQDRLRRNPRMDQPVR